MELSIAEWGNSLAFRIPKKLAESLGLKKGSKVEAQIKSGKLIINPEINDDFLKEMAKGFDMEAALKRITPENQPDPADFDFGPPVGKEIW